MLTACHPPHFIILRPINSRTTGGHDLPTRPTHSTTTPTAHTCELTARRTGVPQQALPIIIPATPSIPATMATKADRIKLPTMQIRTITQTEQQARTTIKLAFESVPILVVGMRGLQITDFEAYWMLTGYSPPAWSSPTSRPHYYTGDSYNPSYNGYQGRSHQTSYYGDSYYHPNRTAGMYY